MLKKFIRNKFIWFALLIVIIFVISFLQDTRQNEVVITPEAVQTKESDDSSNDTKEETQTNEEKKEIIVDIKGAVTSPGVYRLEVGKRVNDAIKLADGFLNGADENKVNLAEKLVDEMVIYVPKIGEESTLQQDEGTIASNDSDENDAIDINHATIEELQKIPGIGPSKAKNILEYIEMNGSFTSIEQLDEVNGIGAKSLEQMRPFILIR